MAFHYRNVHNIIHTEADAGKKQNKPSECVQSTIRWRQWSEWSRKERKNERGKRPLRLRRWYLGAGFSCPEHNNNNMLSFLMNPRVTMDRMMMMVVGATLMIILRTNIPTMDGLKGSRVGGWFV